MSGALRTSEFFDLVRKGEALAIVIDTMTLFAREHPEGSICIPCNTRNWVKEVTERANQFGAGIGLLSSRKDRMDRCLLLISGSGLRVIYQNSGGRTSWESEGLNVVRTESLGVDDLIRNLQDFKVLDVREEEELKGGVIPGSIHLPMSDISEWIKFLDERPKYATICSHGGRSRRAATMLSMEGYDAVTVRGGYSLWKKRGYSLKQI